MRNAILVSVVIFICHSVFSQGKDERQIRDILAAQTEQWNKGNIDAFMQGYWHSDSLVFIGKNGPHYGYRAALQNYKKGYPDTTAMGKLSFDILSVKPLSPQYYFVTGKWMLKRSIGDLQGYYTLLFRRINGKWTIVVDHSS